MCPVYIGNVWPVFDFLRKLAGWYIRLNVESGEGTHKAWHSLSGRKLAELHSPILWRTVVLSTSPSFGVLGIACVLLSLPRISQDVLSFNWNKCFQGRHSAT